MKKEDEHIDSYLKSLGAEGSYKVPVNYFESLEDSILKKISEQEKRKKSKIIQFYWVSAAAVLMVAGFLFWFSPVMPNEEEANIMSTDVVLEEIGSDDLSIDLLCDAGWCLELENIKSLPDSTLDSSDEWIIESDVLLDEI